MRKVRNYFITIAIVLISLNAFAGENLAETEKERKALNEKYDRLKLREKTDFVIDCSPDFLVEPGKPAVGEYSVAKVPPTIQMMILPDMEPEYFPGGENYMAGWANWAHMTRSDDNRFYCSVSDHRGFGCNINLYEYCPGRNLVHKVLDVDELLGWTKHTYTDGKIHGLMQVMPDGTLWAATHYGVYPDSSWWANGYRGSWLFSYNIYTHEARNWGVPLVGNMLPCFNIDTKRGRLVGTGANLTVLCWDCINKKVRYAGYLPNGWEWWRRAMLCDEATGKFWSTDNSDDKYRFISFDPEYNRFERYDLSPPENPFTHKVMNLRGYTDRPAVDGWYYCTTSNTSGGGVLFKFKPEGSDGPVVESLGTDWDIGEDTLQMMVSPSGRYVYYYPRSYTAPLVQYDVKTGKKKLSAGLMNTTLQSTATGSV